MKAWRGLRVEHGERISRHSAPAILYCSSEYGHAERYALTGDPQERGYIQCLSLDGLRIVPMSRIREFRGRIGGGAYFYGQDAVWAASILAERGLDGVSYNEAGFRCYALRTDAAYSRVRTRTRDQWERIVA